MRAVLTLSAVIFLTALLAAPAIPATGARSPDDEVDRIDKADADGVSSRNDDDRGRPARASSPATGATAAEPVEAVPGRTRWKRMKKGRDDRRREQTRVVVQSLSNKILDVQVVAGAEQGSFLLLTLGTDIYANPNLVPAYGCSAFRSLAFDLGSPNTTEMEKELTRRAALAAKLGPFRAKLGIIQGECLQLPGHGDATFPVGTSITIISERP